MRSEYYCIKDEHDDDDNGVECCGRIISIYYFKPHQSLTNYFNFFSVLLALAGWAIALIVLAVLFAAAVIVGAVVYVHQRAQRRDQHYDVDALDVMDRPKKFVRRRQPLLFLN